MKIFMEPITPPPLRQRIEREFELIVREMGLSENPYTVRLDFYVDPPVLDSETGSVGYRGGSVLGPENGS